MSRRTGAPASAFDLLVIRWLTSRHIGVEEWLECAPVWITAPTDRHRNVLGDLLRQTVPRANLVANAHLAALAIEHGAEVCSADTDFARFPGLRWTTPLA